MLDPGYVLVAILGVVIAAPAVAAVLSFLPNASLRRTGRWLLVFGWVTCAAAVIGCIWLATRESSGIGNHVFFLVAIVPAVLGAIWFMVWSIARRLEFLRSLPPAQRMVEERKDIEKSIELVSRDLRRQERRARSWFLPAKEKKRLEAEVMMLRMTLARLEEKRPNTSSA